MRREWISWVSASRVSCVAVSALFFLVSTVTRAQEEVVVPRPGELEEGTVTLSEKPPKPIQIVDPEHPKGARAGKVLLRVVVSETGEVTSVTDAVERDPRTDRPELREAAVAAVKQWTFEPALQDGKAVGSMIAVPISFGGLPDDRPDGIVVSELALHAKEMEPHWRMDEFPERAPLVLLLNRQLRQFGTASSFELVMFEAPVVVVADANEVGNRAYVEFTRLSIQGSKARAEYEYSAEAVRCVVDLIKNEGWWEIKEAKVKRSK